MNGQLILRCAALVCTLMLLTGNALAASVHSHAESSLAHSPGPALSLAATSRYPLTAGPLVWLEKKVTASDGAMGSHFGSSVALSGQAAIIGAIGDNEFQGAAYVFNESGDKWMQITKLTANDGAAGDLFGYSAAFTGMTAIIGAVAADVNGNTNQGAAYVFRKASGKWTQIEKLTASDGAAGDHFGCSVAVSGRTALVGAPSATVKGKPGQGVVYVFTELKGTWTRTAKLTMRGGAAGDGFGVSVALSGTTALVGASSAPAPTMQARGPGAVYVFTKSGGIWTQTAKLMARDGAAGDLFGASVALSDKTAVVGAQFANVNGNFHGGAAYVFTESNDTWTQQAKLTASNSAVRDLFGGSVALSGKTAVVSAYGATIKGNSNQGAAYVFTESNETWRQTKKFTARNGTADNFYGLATAFNGTTVLVGDDAATVSGALFQGLAYFYGERNPVSRHVRGK